MKWVIAVVVLAGLAGGGWWLYERDHDAPTDYQTTTVTRGDVIQTVTATGTLNPVTNITVGSQISGIIQSLNADWNTHVKANQVVAQLDPATYRSAVAQAEGDLANAKATLELNQVEAKRSTELFKDKLISASEYDSTIANLHQAEAMVQIKQASLDNAKVNLSRCTIYSPVDGIVISRNVDVGQTVAASLSAPTLFVIANDLTKMQIDANVAEADVGGIEAGQKVDFTVDAYPYRTFHGEVFQVRNSPTTIQNVVTYDTVVSVNNADLKLKPGMTANVSIITSAHNDVLKLMNAAFRFRPPDTGAGTNEPAGGREGRGGGFRPGGPGGPGEGPGAGGGRPRRAMNVRTVYLLPAGDPQKPGQDLPLKPVQIKTGINDGIYTEVMDGLKEGDQVVTGVNTQAEKASGEINNPFGGGFRRRR